MDIFEKFWDPIHRSINVFDLEKLKLPNVYDEVDIWGDYQLFSIKYLLLSLSSMNETKTP